MFQVTSVYTNASTLYTESSSVRWTGICHRNKVNSTACSASVTGLKGAQ